MSDVLNMLVSKPLKPLGLSVPPRPWCSPPSLLGSPCALAQDDGEHPDQRGEPRDEMTDGNVVNGGGGSAELGGGAEPSVATPPSPSDGRTPPVDCIDSETCNAQVLRERDRTFASSQSVSCLALTSTSTLTLPSTPTIIIAVSLLPCACELRARLHPTSAVQRDPAHTVPRRQQLVRRLLPTPRLFFSSR